MSVQKSMQVTMNLTLSLLIVSIASACAPQSTVVVDSANDPSSVQSSPSADPGEMQEWSRDEALRYAENKLDFAITEADVDRLQQCDDFKNSVSREDAIAAARKLSGSQEALLAAEPIAVVSRSFGTGDDKSMTPAMNDTLIWLVILKTHVMNFSEIQIAMAEQQGRELDNTLVEAVSAVPVDAQSGEPYFSKTQ